jgi:hypothetical protein
VPQRAGFCGLSAHIQIATPIPPARFCFADAKLAHLPQLGE